MTMLNNLPQNRNCSYTNIHQREMSAMERHEDESNKKMFPIYVNSRFTQQMAAG